jgi:hypothetical protein
LGLVGIHRRANHRYVRGIYSSELQSRHDTVTALEWNSRYESENILHRRSRIPGQCIHYGKRDPTARGYGASSTISVTPPLIVLHQGATHARARAALKRYSDVMEAAERIFDGAFDDITDDAAASMPSAGPIKEPERCRPIARLVVCPLSCALSDGSYTTIDSRGGGQGF